MGGFNNQESRVYIMYLSLRFPGIPEDQDRKVESLRPSPSRYFSPNHQKTSTALLELPWSPRPSPLRAAQTVRERRHKALHVLGASRSEEGGALGMKGGPLRLQTSFGQGPHVWDLLMGGAE